MILRGGQFRALALGEFGARVFGVVPVAGDGDGLDGGGAALGRDGIEARGAHGDDLLGVGGFHRGERVAGIDRADEGVGVDDVGDVADRLHVQQRGGAGQHVLAGGGGGGEDMALAGGERDQQRGQRLGQRIGVARRRRRPAPWSRRGFWRRLRRHRRRRRRRPAHAPRHRAWRRRRWRCGTAA